MMAGRPGQGRLDVMEKGGLVLMTCYHRIVRFGLLAAAVALAPVAANAEEFINILTGGTGGVYYPLGVAISKIYAEKIPGAKPSVQSTKASVENLNLLQAGKGEIAFTLGDPRFVRLVRLHNCRDSEVGRGEDGLALSVGADPGGHLQGQRQGCGCCGGAELSGHPRRIVRPGGLRDDQDHLRQPVLAAGRACRRQGHDPRQGGQEPAGAAPPGCSEVL